MRKLLITAQVIAVAALATSPAYARWGTPAPTWFAHSCASPGARFANAAYCSQRIATAKTTVHAARANRRGHTPG